nr:MAG TPA: hypothetical protein [Caudoviricetes sp.]
MKDAFFIVTLLAVAVLIFGAATLFSLLFLKEFFIFIILSLGV